MGDSIRASDGTGDTLRAADLLSGSPPRETTLEYIRRAIRDDGYLVLSGLFDERPADRALLGQMEAFFSLADTDPRKQAINVQHRSVKYGWMPLYGEPAYEAGTRARVESFDCGLPEVGHADNLWPALAGFRAATRAAWQRYSEAGFAVLEHIAVATGLPATFLRERCTSQELSTMRLLHYPGQSQPAGNRDVGISAHSDFECITLLYQTAAGLELCNRQGKWADAPYGDREVIVLFGDMLETWTNGTIRATAHRVRMTPEARFSVVLFFAVDDNVTVAPLPMFAGNGRSAYNAVTQRSHSRRQLSAAEKNRDAQ